MIVSRAAIDYIFDEINIRPLMKQLNDMVEFHNTFIISSVPLFVLCSRFLLTVK